MPPPLPLWGLGKIGPPPPPQTLHQANLKGFFFKKVFFPQPYLPSIICPSFALINLVIFLVGKEKNLWGFPPKKIIKKSKSFFNWPNGGTLWEKTRDLFGKKIKI